MEDKNAGLIRLGFSFGISGVHLARTMMFADLSTLIDCVDQEPASLETYACAIVEQNCTGKPSGKSRQLTLRHLISLYALDPEVLLYRALLFYWQRDEVGRPLLALLCAYARDAILRESAPFILDLPEGTVTTRADTQAFCEKNYPDRFSAAMLKSLAQNLNGTWTRSGHLNGRIKKIRTKPQVTAGAVAYALLLAYLTGGRGLNLFSSEYIKLLDCGRERAHQLAEEASRRGWMTFKSIGDVVEVQFPQLLTAEEKELVSEQA